MATPPKQPQDHKRPVDERHFEFTDADGTSHRFVKPMGDIPGGLLLDLEAGDAGAMRTLVELMAGEDAYQALRALPARRMMAEVKRFSEEAELGEG